MLLRLSSLGDTLIPHLKSTIESSITPNLVSTDDPHGALRSTRVVGRESFPITSIYPLPDTVPTTNSLPEQNEKNEMTSITESNACTGAFTATGDVPDESGISIGPNTQPQEEMAPQSTSPPHDEEDDTDTLRHEQPPALFFCHYTQPDTVKKEQDIAVPNKQTGRNHQKMPLSQESFNSKRNKKKAQPQPRKSLSKTSSRRPPIRARQKHQPAVSAVVKEPTSKPSRISSRLANQNVEDMQLVVMKTLQELGEKLLQNIPSLPDQPADSCHERYNRPPGLRMQDMVVRDRSSRRKKCSSNKRQYANVRSSRVRVHSHIGSGRLSSTTSSRSYLSDTSSFATSTFSRRKPRQHLRSGDPKSVNKVLVKKNESRKELPEPQESIDSVQKKEFKREESLSVRKKESKREQSPPEITRNTISIEALEINSDDQERKSASDKEKENVNCELEAHDSTISQPSSPPLSNEERSSLVVSSVLPESVQVEPTSDVTETSVEDYEDDFNDYEDDFVRVYDQTYSEKF